MPGYIPAAIPLGYKPATEIYTPTTTQDFPLGMTLAAYDEFFGLGHFVYGQAVATPGPGNLVYPAFNMQMTAVPNTANTGYPILVARATFAAASFGWFQYAGMTPVVTANSVAAGVAAGIAAAGSAGTNAAGKQILGGVVTKASTYAPTQNIRTHNGSKVIQVTSTAGLIKGLAVTGTGVGASAVIVTINPSGNEITVDVASTASAVVVGTFTWTGFLLMYLQNAHVQGAIT